MTTVRTIYDRELAVSFWKSLLIGVCVGDAGRGGLRGSLELAVDTQKTRNIMRKPHQFVGKTIIRIVLRLAPACSRAAWKITTCVSVLQKLSFCLSDTHLFCRFCCLGGLTSNAGV